MNADVLLRLLARLLPPLARERYLEEWRADLAGAGQVHLPSRTVLLGAAALVLGIDRDHPDHTGEARGAVPQRLARRGGGLLVAGGAVLASAWLSGGALPPDRSGGFAGLVLLPVVLAAIAGVVGAALMLAAGVASRTWLARASLAALVAGGGLVADGVVWSAGSAATVGVLTFLAGLIGGGVVLAGTAPPQRAHRESTRAQRLPVAAAGLLLLIGLVGFGGIDVLVWWPLSKVPGLDLSTIYALMAQRDGFFIELNVGGVIVWAAFWLAGGIAVAARAAAPGRSTLTPRRIAVILLGLIAGAAVFRFFAGFGIGMSIADSFATDGGERTPVTTVIQIVGTAAFAGAAIAIGWTPRVRVAVR